MVALPPDARAQGWSAEVQGGSVRYQTGPTSLAVSNLTVGLSYLSGFRQLGVSAGIPLQDGDPAWGALDAGDRLLLRPGPLLLGVDVGGAFFLQHDHRLDEGPEDVPGPSDPPGPPGGADETPLVDNDGYGVRGEVMPVLGWNVGPGRVELRGGVAAYHDAFGAGEGDDPEESFTRTAGMADLQASLPLGTRALLAPQARYARVEGRDFPFAGMTAVAVTGRVSAWASVGHWFSDVVDEVPWSVGASVTTGRRVELTTQYRQDAFDPLFGAVPRRSWSVGVAVRLQPPPSVARPVPAAYEDGRAVLILAQGEVPPGEAPRIAGDFTDWEPVPMESGPGGWRYTVALDPGVYHYAFVTDGGEWFVPETTPGRRDDGMGGFVAVLVVEQP